MDNPPVALAPTRKGSRAVKGTTDGRRLDRRSPSLLDYRRQASRGAAAPSAMIEGWLMARLTEHPPNVSSKRRRTSAPARLASVAAPAERKMRAFPRVDPPRAAAPAPANAQPADLWPGKLVPGDLCISWKMVEKLREFYKWGLRRGAWRGAAPEAGHTTPLEGGQGGQEGQCLSSTAQEKAERRTEQVAAAAVAAEVRPPSA